MQRNFTHMLTMLMAFVMLFSSAFAATLPAPVNPEPYPVNVKSAVADFNNLSKKEKKEKAKEVKKAIKQYKAEKKAGKIPVKKKP